MPRIFQNERKIQPLRIDDDWSFLIGATSKLILMAYDMCDLWSSWIARNQSTVGLTWFNCHVVFTHLLWSSLLACSITIAHTNIFILHHFTRCLVMFYGRSLSKGQKPLPVTVVFLFHLLLEMHSSYCEFFLLVWYVVLNLQYYHYAFQGLNRGKEGLE